jgi:uncharacterized protein (TIGR04255 family)
MVNLSPDGNTAGTAVESQTEGFRRASTDQQEITLLMPGSLIVSQLAPYPGWDTFFGRFQRDWLSWKEAVSYNKVSRVGIRYINRIDIPATDSPIIMQEEYINVGVQAPDSLGPTIAYASQAVFGLPAIQSKLVVNTAVVLPPPIPGYASFLIDLDLGREEGVPQRDDMIFALLGQMRTEKNRIFEDCITDKARDLFQ